MKDGVALRQDLSPFVEDDDGPRRKESGAGAYEPAHGRLAAKRREPEPDSVPVPPRQEGDAPVTQAAIAVVEDEVGHGPSVHLIDRGGAMWAGPGEAAVVAAH